MKTYINSSKLTIILLCFLMPASILLAQSTAQSIPGTPNIAWIDYQHLHLKNSAEVKSLTDSIHQSSYDTVSETFKLTQRTFHNYDSGGMLIQRTKLLKDKSGNWKNYSKDTLVYIGLQLRKVVNQQWDAQQSSWKNTLKFDYYYDTTNVLSSIIMSSWNSTESMWELSEKQYYSYNSGGQLIEDLYQVWNENLNIWENRSRTSNSYNGSQLAVELYEQWDPVGLSWQNYSRSTYSYNSGNLSQILKEAYVQALSSWVNMGRNTLTYNTSGKKETDTEENWLSGNWINSIRESYTYDGENLKTTTEKKWQSHLNDWRNNSLTENFFSDHDVFGIREEKAIEIIVNNPVARGTEVKLHLAAGQFAREIVLVDLTGKKALSANLSNQETITIPAGIPAGIYILKCRLSNGLIKVQKLLITE